jgi:hypothetical protein
MVESSAVAVGMGGAQCRIGYCLLFSAIRKYLLMKYDVWNFL